MNIKCSSIGGVVVLQNQRKLIANNIEYDMPKSMKGNNVTIVNGKAYVDGFELIDGKWKKTLKALWYKIF